MPGVLLAIGLIAYNTQTLKSTYYAVGGNELLAPRASILGALNLYVSFVILFQNLLYLTGNRR
ncbi:MAG: Bax inhibitor-1 family protein [Alphaproteobacteria bacterium]